MQEIFLVRNIGLVLGRIHDLCFKIIKSDKIHLINLFFLELEIRDFPVELQQICLDKLPVFQERLLQVRNSFLTPNFFISETLILTPSSSKSSLFAASSKLWPALTWPAADISQRSG